MPLKLIDIKPSTRDTKKYMAEFITPKGTTKTTHFGAKGYDDFILSGGNEMKKKAYIARHGATESFKNPTDASTLARYVLWNKPTLKASIDDYKKRFGL